MSKITLQEIIREVPAVAAVLSAMPRVDSDKWDATYVRYKRILRDLVGWSAPAYDNDLLNSHWAYDVVITALLDVLDGVLELPGLEGGGGMITLTVPDTPRGKERPRATTREGFARTGCESC